MRQARVLFIWDVRPELRDYLRAGLAKVPGAEPVFPEKTDDADLIAAAREADIIVGWRPGRELLEAATSLRLFINPGAGVQHLVPLFRETAGRRGAVLVNGHGNSYFTAQHAVALLLALTNRVVAHHNWLAQGDWRRTEPESLPLRGRTVGLLGYGHVNHRVHLFLAGFDVAFAALRREWPRPPEPTPTPLARFEPSGLRLFLARVDTLIVALPETPATVGLLGAEELALLGPEGLLVHVGRGPVVAEDALYAALRDRTIAGAALDVWYRYQPEPDDQGRRFPFTLPFHELDNVVLSPHRGASPMSDLGRWDEVIENVARYCRGEDTFLNIVDTERGY